MKFRALVFVAIVVLGGCRNQPLNPPRLVQDSDTDVTIQLFVQASIMMMRSYGLATISYEEFLARAGRANIPLTAFVPPTFVPTRAAPQLTAVVTGESGPFPPNIQALGTKPFVKYYIRTGLRASQLICRNHLTRLDEGNQYIEFLQKELGVFSTFASGVLALVNANSTLTKSFLITFTGVNAGFDAYQEYRFLSIDRDAARILVETAQNKLAEFFMNQVDAADVKGAVSNSAAGGYTYSDALNAVSVIEYQCTREGIRYLLNRSINNTPSNMEIDAATGTILFKSAKDQTQEGTGSAAVITGAKKPLRPVAPAR